MSKYQFSFASCEGASLCVPSYSRVSIHLYISEYTCDCAWEFVLEYAHTLCVCVCVRGKCCRGKAYMGRFGSAWRLLSSSFWQKEEEEKKNTNIPPSILFLLLILYLALTLFSFLPLSFCITYKGSRFHQNEATYGRYANEIIARGLEWDTIYPKSWLSIMAGD